MVGTVSFSGTIYAELPLKFEGEAADREIQETCDVKKSMPSGLVPNTLDNKEEPKK